MDLNEWVKKASMWWQSIVDSSIDSALACSDTLGDWLYDQDCPDEIKDQVILEVAKQFYSEEEIEELNNANEEFYNQYPNLRRSSLEKVVRAAIKEVTSALTLEEYREQGWQQSGFTYSEAQRYADDLDPYSAKEYKAYIRKYEDDKSVPWLNPREWLVKEKSWSEFDLEGLSSMKRKSDDSSFKKKYRKDMLKYFDSTLSKTIKDCIEWQGVDDIDWDYVNDYMNDYKEDMQDFDEFFNGNAFKEYEKKVREALEWEEAFHKGTLTEYQEKLKEGSKMKKEDIIKEAIREVLADVDDEDEEIMPEGYDADLEASYKEINNAADKLNNAMQKAINVMNEKYPGDPSFEGLIFDMEETHRAIDNVVGLSSSY